MEENGKKIWTKNFIILFTGQFLLQFGNYLTQQLLSLYAKSLGANDIIIGTISSAFYTVALLARPFSSPAIDCWNRKKMFIILNACNALWMYGYAFTGNITGIFVFRMLNGITHGTSAALCLAMATQNLDVSMLASGIAAFTMAQTLPQAVGPSIGLFLSEHFGYKVTYLISGTLMLIGALVGTKLDYSDFKKKKFTVDLNSIISIPALVPMFLILLLGLGYGTTSSFYAVMVKERELPGLSVYFIVYAASMLLFRPIAAKLSEKYGIDKLLYPTFAMFTVCLVFMSKASNAFDVIFSGVLHGIGYSCTYSLLQALVMAVTPKSRRGAGSSTCYIGMDAGLMIGGFVAGNLAKAYGYGTLFVVMGATQLLGILFLAIWVKAKGGVPVCEE